MNRDLTNLPDNLKALVAAADSLASKIELDVRALERAGFDIDTIVSVLEEKYRLDLDAHLIKEHIATRPNPMN